MLFGSAGKTLLQHLESIPPSLELKESILLQGGPESNLFDPFEGLFIKNALLELEIQPPHGHVSNHFFPMLAPQSGTDILGVVKKIWIISLFLQNLQIFEGVPIRPRQQHNPK